MIDEFDGGCDWCWSDPCKCTELTMLQRLIYDMVGDFAKHDGPLALGYLDAMECIVNGVVSTDIETEL
jgi:hypothetical protein